VRRQYKGAAPPAVLTTALAASTASVTINCNNLPDSTWPNGSVGPFYIIVDRGLQNEEKMLCSSRVGNTITVLNRAADETGLSAHSINAVVEHVFTAVDADEANLHVNTDSIHLNATRVGITTCTNATRPSSPSVNQIIFETDTYNMLAWNGTAWSDITGGEALNEFFLIGA
jgi:hypothetical protein